MTKEEKRSLMRPFAIMFQNNGYPNACYDGSVLKIEKFPNGVHLQLWIGRSGVFLGVYADKSSVCELIIKHVGEDWTPEWSVDSGHEGNWETWKLYLEQRSLNDVPRPQRGGVLLKMKLKKPWVGDKVLEAYKQLHDKILPSACNRVGVRERYLMSCLNSDPELNLIGVDDFLSSRIFHSSLDSECYSAYDLAEHCQEGSIVCDEADSEHYNINTKEEIKRFNGFCKGGQNEDICIEHSEELRAKVARIEATRHVIAMLKHTYGKQYENYVVTGVWHRLRSLGLNVRPVTQQFVARRDGDYERAYIDLYFPGLALAVECDEKYHLRQQDEDSKRQEELKAALQIKYFERVDASCSYELMDAKIDYIVRLISKLMKTEEQKDRVEEDWLFYDPISAVRKEGKMTVARGLVFARKEDIITALGSLIYSLQANTICVLLNGIPRRCYFINGADVRFNKLGLNVDEIVARRIRDKELKEDKKVEKKDCDKIRREVEEEIKWRDLSDDYAKDFKLSAMQDYEQELKKKDDNMLLDPEDSLVFVKFKDRAGLDGYRFLGIYKREDDRFTRTSNSQVLGHD